jgi:hypothetical protein
MSKHNVETVRDCVSKLNKNRALIKDLEKRLKPFLDAKKTVAKYLKDNPSTGVMFDNDDEHYCFSIRSIQTRFSPEKARELLGDAAADCYEEKPMVTVGFGVDKDDELDGLDEMRS